MTRIALILAALMAAAPLTAETPEIIGVEADPSDMGWRINVTLKHPDTGWDHYADGWEITDLDGNRLAYRELMHPHVHEQPFTRSLHNVVLPDGTTEVYVRAHCSMDDWTSDAVRVELSR